MAGSRSHYSSILKRIQGLLRSGAMKEEDRPIWYDIVKAIPPKPLPPARSVQKILYPEDFIRVQFHRVYQYNGFNSLGSGPVKSIPEKFVDTYKELHQKQTVPFDELFEQTVETLKKQGIKLIRHNERTRTSQNVSYLMFREINENIGTDYITVTDITKDGHSTRIRHEQTIC